MKHSLRDNSVRSIVDHVTTAPRRRGPVPRFSREQLVDAAVAVVEAKGFDALSLRSVARHLDIGPMTLYTYVDGSEELAALVVERLVDDTVRDLRWPRSWRGVLRLFAKELDGLVEKHPAMVVAYQRGMVRSGRAEQVARDVLGRLTADGLSPKQARDAYLAVHAVVLGYALMRAGRQHATAGNSGQDAGETAAQRSSLETVPLARLVDKVLDGVAPS